jgi:hypothetical protein
MRLVFYVWVESCVEGRQQHDVAASQVIESQELCSFSSSRRPADTVLQNPNPGPSNTKPTLLDLIFPSKPSTFGAPSRPTSPQQPQSYLPPLPDPFFLPPPFTPSHDFFHMIARQAASHAADVRARAEHEVAVFVTRKRREVEEEEMAVRGQVEYLWKAFERGQREQGIDGVDEARGRGPVSPNGARKTSFGAVVRPDLTSPTGETSFGGAGSLLSASLSTH